MIYNFLINNFIGCKPRTEFVVKISRQKLLSGYSLDVVIDLFVHCCPLGLFWCKGLNIKLSCIVLEYPGKEKHTFLSMGCDTNKL